MRYWFLPFLTVVVAGLGVAAWWLRPVPVSSPQTQARTSREPVEIPLANRTAVADGFPSAFCEHQSPSARVIGIRSDLAADVRGEIQR